LCGVCLFRPGSQNPKVRVRSVLTSGHGVHFVASACTLQNCGIAPTSSRKHARVRAGVRSGCFIRTGNLRRRTSRTADHTLPLQQGCASRAALALVYYVYVNCQYGGHIRIRLAINFGVVPESLCSDVIGFRSDFRRSRFACQSVPTGLRWSRFASKSQPAGPCRSQSPCECQVSQAIRIRRRPWVGQPR
jgi:hypothetical protein